MYLNVWMGSVVVGGTVRAVVTAATARPTDEPPPTRTRRAATRITQVQRGEGQRGEEKRLWSEQAPITPTPGGSILDVASLTLVSLTVVSLVCASCVWWSGFQSPLSEEEEEEEDEGTLPGTRPSSTYSHTTHSLDIQVSTKYTYISTEGSGKGGQCSW
jgi:hypothetical protein